MVTLNAHFDGKVIVPDEPVGLAAGSRLRVTVVSISEPPHSTAQKLDLPLLKGVDPALARAIAEDAEFDIENAKIERLQNDHL